jgi:hypothetical protein
MSYSLCEGKSFPRSRRQVAANCGARSSIASSFALGGSIPASSSSGMFATGFGLTGCTSA